MAISYIGLGSNLGNRENMLIRSMEYLNQSPNTNITNRSSFYETKPVGGPPQGDFINAAIEVETQLSPESLLTELHGIEERLRRKRVIKDGPRAIDMDILLFDNIILNTVRLNIPHPLMHKRMFVLEPLTEIAPQLKHPVSGKSIIQLRDMLKRMFQTKDVVSTDLDSV